jgi:hypothetical protein
MTILLVEITAATDSAGNTTTLRYATQGYNDPSAPGFYAEKIQETISIRRELRGATGGSGTVSFSDLVLINADGDLDALEGYGFDGRQIKGLLLDGTSDVYGNATTLFTATMGAPSFDLDTVTIPIRDRLAELDQQLHSSFYDGSNTLPNGLEGTGDDIQGQPKPEPEGEAFNVRPPFVNTSRLIWEFAAGDREADVTDVFEGGIALTRGADYTSQSDMENNAPSAGEYRVWPRSGSPLEGGYFRLGSSPTHTITADVQAGAASGDRTIAQVLQNLAERAPTISASDINSTDVTDLDSALGEPIGLWVPSESTILREMERLAQGAGVYFGFDRNGTLRMAKWDAPGTSVATFKEARASQGTTLASDEYDLVNLEGEPTREEDTPVYDVTARWQRNYTVQADLQTNVADDRRAIIENEWRRAKATDSSIQDKHKNARAVELDTPYQTRTGAQDVADRTLTRDKVQRRRWRLRASLSNNLSGTVDLADTVTITLDRLDFTGGKKHRVKALEADPVRGEIEYEVWG